VVVDAETTADFGDAKLGTRWFTGLLGLLVMLVGGAEAGLDRVVQFKLPAREKRFSTDSSALDPADDAGDFGRFLARLEESTNDAALRHRVGEPIIG
jgi:hypothetical protein